MNCKRCGGGPLAPGNHRRGVPYGRVHFGRGLCGPCYSAELAADRLLDWPRSTWRTDELVAEAEMVRALRRPAELGRESLYWWEVAEVLAVPYPTLKKAREREQARRRMVAA